jgi:hypothetical protein
MQRFMDDPTIVNDAPPATTIVLSAPVSSGQSGLIRSRRGFWCRLEGIR